MAEVVSIQDLRPGMVILGIVEQNGPVKIRKSGLVTSVEMVQGLAEMGVLSVNIDPEQTVEVENATQQPMSQTQFVLKANAEKPKKDADSHLSEQFNRSLFLPSLQRVPSAWQYYSRQVAIALLVVIGGFAIGWLSGSYPRWLADNSPQISVNSTAISASTNTASSVTSDNLATKAESAVVAPTSSIPAQNANVSPTGVSEQEAAFGESEQPITLGYVPESDDEQSAADNTATLNTANSDISPELLERFEKAMADLEKESAVDTRTVEDDPEPVSYSRVENVLRVDQLPARVMARLPSLSFSAHMYASNPKDRWVKVNDVEVGEGDWLTDDLMIERIEPQHVIMIFQGHQFSMRALSDW